MQTALDYIKNPIKNHIIKNLMTHRKLKYSELMPEDVDNVLFNYHLQHLVRQGLIFKDEECYALTQDGIQFTQNISEGGLYFPKFVNSYKMYLIQGDKLLLQMCSHRPWYGDTTPLLSKVLYGTATEERANTRMREKVGVTTKMKWIGILRTLVYSKEKDIIDDTFYTVCFADYYEGTIKKLDDSDHPLTWHTFEEAIAFEKKNKGSGDKSIEILRRLQEKNYSPFLFEESVEAETPI